MDNVLQYRGNIGNYQRYFYFNRDTGYGEWYARKKPKEIHPYSYEDVVTPNSKGVFRIFYSQALGESPIEDDIGILESINNAYNFGKYIKDGSGIKSPISFDTPRDDTFIVETNHGYSVFLGDDFVGTFKTIDQAQGVVDKFINEPVAESLSLREDADTYGGYVIIQTGYGWRIKDCHGDWFGGEFATPEDAADYIRWLRRETSSIDEDLSIDDDPEESDQRISSSATSVNSSKLPAIFSLVRFQPGSINLDYGGGKFDNAEEFLNDRYDATNLVYDKYNRSSEHNSNVLKEVRKNGGADTVTLSNVLNVIAEPEERLAVLRNCKRFVKPGGKVYITVYEGVKGKGPSETKSGYQLNRQTKDYEDELKEVFNSVTRKGKLFICS